MNGLVKKMALGVGMAAATLAVAAPAEAQYRGSYYGYSHHGDTTGAAILGGILGLGVGAAIASSSNNRYYDRGYYQPRPYYNGYGYNGYDSYYSYQPRCWTERHYDPYYGYSVPVQVCR